MADKRAYAKFDVGYLDNPKVGPLLEDDRPYAVILHAASILYSAQHLTDGVVRVRTLLRKTGASSDDVAALVSAGLWDDNGDGTASIHDYLEHNRSAEQALGASAKAKHAAQSRYGHAPKHADEHAQGAASSMPIEREKERTTSSTAPRPDDTPNGFSDFWAAYPRKEAKRKAEQAYRAALKRTRGDSQVILDGARRYAASKPEPKFTAMPTTWLNGDRWADQASATGATAVETPSFWTRGPV